MSTLGSNEQDTLSRWQARALGLGAAGLVVCALGGYFDPGQFFRAYLAAYLFFLGIALGGMAILLIHQVTGGAWGYLIRRVLEAQMKTLPLLAALFLPIAFGVGRLYRWAQPEQVAASAKLQYQQFYLRPEYFWWRVAIYFALWLGVSYVFALWLGRLDRSGNPRPASKLATFGGVGLVIYGVTLHFATLDWIMSLESEFPSTIFAPLVVSGQMLSAQAMAIVVFAWLAARSPVAEVFSLKALNDLGNLLLAMLVIWCYMVWFQFMIVWIANLPDDVAWYLPLGRGGWFWVAMALLVFQFVVPFFLLLFRAVTQNTRILAPVAGLILFMQLVFSYYQVMPRFPDTTLAEHWLDFVAPVGIGGVWLAYFLRQWRAASVLPQQDLGAEEARRLRELDEEELAREEMLVHD